MSDTFCKLPFTHFYVDGNRYKPCCVSADESDDIALLDDIRKQFMNGEVPTGCSTCFNKEKIGVKSYRQWYSETYPNLEFEYVDNLLSVPKTFDIRLDTSCNLKCVMCSPQQSSKWAEDLEIYEKYVGKSKNLTTERRSKLDELSEITKDAVEIYLLGGEPFYMKSAYKLLDNISKRKFNRENTRIIINTNAIVKKDNKLLEVLTRFNLLYFIISLDGYKDVNEYIRFPTKWDEFIEGIEILHSMEMRKGETISLKNGKFKKAFNVTVSALNILDIENILKFASTQKNIPHFNFLNHPECLSLNAINPKVIEYLDLPPELHEIKDYIDNHYEYNPKLNDTMKKYLSELDKKRNINSKNIIPWCWI